MDKKRDKFAKLRAKKCSQIDGCSSQITNFFNPKISSSTSGMIGSDIVSQQSDTVPEALESSGDDLGHSNIKRLKIEESKKSTKERRKPEAKKRPAPSSKNEGKLFSKKFVQQSLADDINPNDLQLALALSRSIADKKSQHVECSEAGTEDDSSQGSKISSKFTLEEYGFESSAQHNKKAMKFLAMEKDFKTFRKMSLLLHRNPKKQNRLFNIKINRLLSKFNDEKICRTEKEYHFLVTSQYLMECYKPTSAIMLVNSNAEGTSASLAQYYCGKIVEPSATKIDVLLRNWDDIPGREMTPNRNQKIYEVMEVDVESHEDVCDKTAESLFHTPKRHQPTPDLLFSDRDSTAKSSVLENISIDLTSDEELPETQENLPTSPYNDNNLSRTGTVEETANDSRNCSKDHEEKLDSVIIIDSDEDEDHEEKINQSISRIVEDHQDIKYLGKRSISDGSFLCRKREQPIQLNISTYKEDPVENIPSTSAINSLFTDDIIMDAFQGTPHEEKEEITFVCETLKNQDISVVRRRGVTPPPNYNAMEPEDIQKELKKYGLKGIKGRKAKILLEHIYNQLHPFIQVEDTMYHLKCKYGLIDASPAPRDSIEDLLENIICNDDTPPVVQHDIVCKDGFLGDIDVRKCIMPCSPRKKVPTCALPLHIAFYNYLQSNREIHEKILQYVPMQLQDIQEHFKSMGIKYEANDLIEFLDKTCITFQSPNTRSRKSPCKRNANALTQ